MQVLESLLMEIQEWCPGVTSSTFDTPEGLENCDGSVWALLEVGETASKTCCARVTPHGRAAIPCKHSFQQVGAMKDGWSPTRKELCIPPDRRLIHATRILDIVQLKYPVQVSTVGGVFNHRIPMSAIPLSTMSSQQRHVWEHTVTLR